MFGSTELMIIVVVVLVLFGSAAVPKFARSLGQAKSEFEKGLKKPTESDTTESDKQTLS
jgi:sec-independent protein translocase protein TatA